MSDLEKQIAARTDDRINDLLIKVTRLEGLRDDLEKLEKDLGLATSRLDKAVKECNTKCDEALQPIKWAKLSIKIITGLAFLLGAITALDNYL